MIVVSLPLILVAVGLLALGLTGGSSNLLISSIVASLLAAVALVIGARQNAGSRRVAQEAVADPGAPAAVPDLAGSDPAGPDFAGPDFASPEFTAERHLTDDFPPGGGAFAADSGGAARDTVQFDPVVDEADDAYRAGRRDTAAGMTAGAPGARRAEGVGVTGDDAFDPRRGDVSGTSRDSVSGVSRDEAPDPRRDDAEPDYERAAEAIHAARSDEEQAWRRPGPGPDGSAGHAEAPAAGSFDEQDAGFGEPDEEDPADEPLPQAVRPADAVRVARMDAEVLVVDGRPRYHVADCPHLIGKLTEPVPVDEAVELGFSPCGLCRPVDRLVAATAHL